MSLCVSKSAMKAALAAAAALLALYADRAYPEGQRLPFASGRITYAVKGGDGTGVSTFMWVDSGARFRQELTFTVPVDRKPLTESGWSVGEAAELFAHQAWMGKEVYRYRVPQDLAVGSPIGLPVFGVQRDLGKSIGKASILDKPCEIYQVNQLKLWMWQGLPLKSSGTAGPGPSLNLTATKIELKANVPEKLFGVPKGYVITEFPLRTEPEGAGKR